MRKADRKIAMLYPVVGVEAWAQLYSLSLAGKPCFNCGKMQYPSIPFASGTWRGLQAPLHECGAEYQLAVARDIDPRDSADWQLIRKVIGETEGLGSAPTDKLQVPV